MHTAAERRERLDAARLYFICDARPGGRALADVLGPALAGGVDVFQLRDKAAGDDDLLRAAAIARGLCDAAGALFVLNDRPGLAAAAGADGAHIGQDDGPIGAARELAGADLLVGRSTHSPEQLAAAHAEGADYLGVGPVHATPTKPGRPAVGLELVAHAAAAATLPWFAIGGIDLAGVDDVARAGATRIAVVRDIAEALDPCASAAALRARLTEPAEVTGGRA
jgi:thiamine-phosphate pyrophosphorylase